MPRQQSHHGWHAGQPVATVQLDGSLILRRAEFRQDDDGRAEFGNERFKLNSAFIWNIGAATRTRNDRPSLTNEAARWTAQSCPACALRRQSESIQHLLGQTPEPWFEMDIADLARVAISERVRALKDHSSDGINRLVADFNRPRTGAPPLWTMR